MNAKTQTDREDGHKSDHGNDDNQGHGNNGGHDNHPRIVEVFIDDKPVKLAAQRYTVPELKTKLGVPLDYELELITKKGFEPLKDGETFHVKGEEKFLSHIPCGGSS